MKFSLGLMEKGDIFLFKKKKQKRKEKGKPWELIMWGLWEVVKKKEISSISEEWWVKSLTEDF